jgi:ERCC4-type nuclease
MSTTPMELLLPLGDTTVPDELTTRRWHHLMTVAGIDARSAQRLARAFPSLAAVYGAGEEQLLAVVGPVVASRIRWFLDAPLDTGLSLRAVAGARAA